MSKTHGIEVATHNPIGPVSSAACMHFNLAISNTLVQELPMRPGQVKTVVLPTGKRFQLA